MRCLFNRLIRQGWLLSGTLSVLTMLFMFTLLLTQSSATAQETLSETGDGILFDDADLNVEFGLYAELELSLSKTVTGPVTWKEEVGTLPPGLWLEDSVAESILIFGTPEFTGRWCVVLSATTATDLDVSDELCFVGKDSETIDYPKFRLGSILDTATQNSTVRERLRYEVESERTYVGEILQSEIPDGTELEFEPENNRFLLSGKPKETGVYRFAVKLTDSLGQANSQQFQIQVDEPAKKDEKSCPSGYYWDKTLGHCVQNKLDTCPSGTYYDESRNACVQYPKPPPTVSCRAGYYYDSWLDRCVRNGVPRCPTGTVWDSYYNQCVSTWVECPVGYRYSWSQHQCVRISYHRSCPIGYHYDWNRGRCEMNSRSCPPGYRWDQSDNRCERTERNCRSNEYWDPQDNRCRPIRAVCGPGTEFNHNLDRCVPIDRPRQCPKGQHWSHQQKRCINNSVTPGPGPMPPMPMPMPMPMPDPMPQPMPMPIPEPSPQPMPMPMPDPMPQPMPAPMPDPMPQPMPMPMPDPMPQPMPMPMPDPMPQPMPAPMPAPMPMPQPMPAPMPAPMPMPQPMPAPMPAPMPMPQPMPQPMPMGMPMGMGN